MSKVFFLCVSFGLMLWLIGCTDGKKNENPAGSPQVVMPTSKQPSVGGMDATGAVKQPKRPFSPSLVSAVSALSGKAIADGITTWDESGNPLQTQFPDRSKLLYAAGGLHQYIDANGKVISYKNDQKNLPVSSVDSDGFIEQFTYDVDGNLISRRNKDGKVVLIGEGGRGK